MTKKDLPPFKKKLLTWENTDQPDARKIIGKQKAPENFIDVNNIKRKNPKLSNDELKFQIKHEIASRYSSLMVGWPERFELQINSILGNTIIFDESSLTHIFDEKFFDCPNGTDRIIDFSKFIDTVQDPWEVWSSQNKKTGSWGLTYFKIYQEKRKNIFCRVDINSSKEKRVTTYFPSKDKVYFNKNRNGIALLYKNNDLVETKK